MPHAPYAALVYLHLLYLRGSHIVPPKLQGLPLDGRDLENFLNFPNPVSFAPGCVVLSTQRRGATPHCWFAGTSCYTFRLLCNVTVSGRASPAYRIMVVAAFFLGAGSVFLQSTQTRPYSNVTLDKWYIA